MNRKNIISAVCAGAMLAATLGDLALQAGQPLPGVPHNLPPQAPPDDHCKFLDGEPRVV